MRKGYLIVAWLPLFGLAASGCGGEGEATVPAGTQVEERTATVRTELVEARQVDEHGGFSVHRSTVRPSASVVTVTEMTIG